MRITLFTLGAVFLLGGCALWPFGGDKDGGRKRTVLFSGGEEIEEDTSGGVCTWDDHSYKARTRVCKDGTFRECLEDGRWRVTGTC